MMEHLQVGTNNLLVLGMEERGLVGAMGYTTMENKITSFDYLHFTTHYSSANIISSPLSRESQLWLLYQEKCAAVHDKGTRGPHLLSNASEPPEFELRNPAGLHLWSW